MFTKTIIKNEVSVQYIGKINRKQLGKYRKKLVTDEVILTNERIKHIKEYHPGDYEKYAIYIPKIIGNPDYIINDNKNLDTLLYIKRIEEDSKNVQIVVKLNTNKNEKEKKNTILTLWKIKDRTYKQLLRNKEIIWKRLDNYE